MIFTASTCAWALCAATTTTSTAGFSKGESYRGLLVFDPLAAEVAQVALVLRDFVLKFNPHDAPLETTTLRFEFQREVQRELVERERDESLSGLVTYTRLGGPLQLDRGAAGNPTRAASALEGELQDRLTDINSCFAREFAAGRAAAGRMKVRFAIDPTGAVAAVEIVDSGVVSAAVDACVRSEIGAVDVCTCRGPHSRRVRPRIYRRDATDGWKAKFVLRAGRRGPAVARVR